MKSGLLFVAVNVVYTHSYRGETWHPFQSGFFVSEKLRRGLGWEKPLPNPSSVEKGGERKKTAQEFIIGPGGTVGMRKGRGEGEGCEDASQK